MKLKRINKNWGCGSGNEIFQSKLFGVTIWKMQKGIRTSLQIRQMFDCYLHFEGKHELTSDRLCIEQLTPTDILRMLKAHQKNSFADGMESKERQIKDCLNI